MHERLARAAQRRGVTVEARAYGAEVVDLPDDSVDAVIATLVLCTVEDPDAVLRQIRRILRPGGRFICIEHVAAPANTFIGRLQRWVFRPWRWVFEGCHTHRTTGDTLRRAGFSELTVEHFTWKSIFLPVRPQIAAVAVK